MDNIFCRRKTWKNIFLHFFVFRKNKKWKTYVLQKEDMEKYFFALFFRKKTSNATKVVCIVLAGGHSETLGDYLLL